MGASNLEVFDDLILNGEHWQYYAECKQANPELFFPISEMSGRNPSPQAAEAISMCQGCLVRERCLEVAPVNSRAQLGIWGGLTTKQRYDLTVKAITMARKRKA